MRNPASSMRTTAPGIREPHSTFGRLFMYSKDTAFTAQENFTTEALAACIRSEPSPMLAALRGIEGRQPPLTVPLASATRLRVTTQVYVAGAGIIDAILTIGDESEILGEVWLEAKIASPEAPDQLAGYARAARSETQKDGLPRDVVALSKWLLDHAVAWLDWRRLYVAAAGTVDSTWHDFRLFMEETRVSDVAMLPITDREAGSISDAAKLIAKVASVIRQVNRQSARLWPPPGEVSWVAEGALLNHVGAVFRQSGRMIMEGGSLRYGAVDSDGTAYWFLALPSRGLRPAALEAMVKSARGKGLGVDWEPRFHLEEFIVRSIRIGERPAHEEAVAWFIEGLEQLSVSGLLADLRTRAKASHRDTVIEETNEET